jgi:hypothetical protein
VQQTNAGNPSSRRDGIRIGLLCEMCNVITHVEIAQHKGHTSVFVRKGGEG